MIFETKHNKQYKKPAIILTGFYYFY